LYNPGNAYAFGFSGTSRNCKGHLGVSAQIWWTNRNPKTYIHTSTHRESNCNTCLDGTTYSIPIGAGTALNKQQPQLQHITMEILERRNKMVGSVSFQRKNYWCKIWCL
jgi:hypothetical protein